MPHFLDVSNSSATIVNGGLLTATDSPATTDEGNGSDSITILQNITSVLLENLISGHGVTIENEYYPDFTQIGVVRGLFVCLFLLEFVVGVIGNILVCATVYRNKSMHSAVNYGIVNLAFCDFLVGGFVLPTKLFELTSSVELNMMNDLSCTVVRFLESVIVFVSVFTLVAICVERYYAVVFPMHSRIHMTSYRIRKILLLVWIIPIMVAAPNLYPASAIPIYLYSEYGEFTRLTCHDTFSDEFRMWYFLFLFCFMYLLPLLFIGTTCFSITRALMRKIPTQQRRDPRAISLEDGRRKVAKMVLVVVLAFVVCWSPYFLVSVITQFQDKNFLHNGQFFFTMLAINLCCFTNSCINPFVYVSMSKRFRTGFSGIFQSLSLCPNESSLSSDINTRTMTSHRRSHRGGRCQTPQDHRFAITASSSPRTTYCSCHRSQRRALVQRTSSDSISFGTPKSCGNSQGQSVKYQRRGAHSSSSHTIVFEFQLGQFPRASDMDSSPPLLPCPQSTSHHHSFTNWRFIENPHSTSY